MRNRGGEIKKETSVLRLDMGRQSHQQKAMPPHPVSFLFLLHTSQLRHPVQIRTCLTYFHRFSPRSREAWKTPRKGMAAVAVAVVVEGSSFHLLTVGNLVKQTCFIAISGCKSTKANDMDMKKWNGSRWERKDTACIFSEKFLVWLHLKPPQN